MANYKEESVSGTKWIRSNRVNITNPFNGMPRVNFGEEEITVLSDGKVHTTIWDGISEEFNDPNTQFDLVNPQTGDLLGSTATYQDVYVLLHSLYISLAKKRDLQQG